MSDFDQLHAVLALIGRRDVIKILFLMHDHGAVTADQLRAAGVARPEQTLRSMATRGLILRAAPGTWDNTAPPDDSTFEPTDRGNELMTALIGLRSRGQWHFVF
jgi:hypothetical protein